ncbi:short-chain dehydrogenase [Talaromyces pinophilus]|uniref:Short-chain dehydrogenase n=1 Tax=Talaromyces pinophilus TaxID=128442 RepID=A0A6N4SLG7_TALPI|nr:short-chain dehydrogenase [Talaromyces pinophilus]
MVSMANNLRINNLFDVGGRWVAITGAASGIGRMVAKGCVVNGAHTIMIDINDQALADTKEELETVSQSEATAAKIVTIKGDLSTEEGINAVVEQITSLRTSLDALFHCAGIRYMNEIAYTPGDSLSQLQAATKSAPYKGWEHTFRLNVLAPYYLTAGLITLLGQATAEGDGRGCVVLFSSPASVHNHQFVPAYQTSKAAVDHLVRIMAAEFAGFYIRVNALSPGIVPSRMTPNDGTSNLRLAHETPAKRPGNEEDMVGLHEEHEKLLLKTAEADWTESKARAANLLAGPGAERAGPDILALNLRSEISLTNYSDGCTSITTATPDASQVFLAQNWDWPRVRMMGEAGIVAKCGINEAGVAVCMNAIRSGKIATIECTPRGLAPIFPEPGTHTTFHTNHLWSPDIPQGIRDHPSKNSFTRLERIKALTKGQVGSVAKIRSWLSDEEGTPVSICRSTPLGARGIRTWYREDGNPEHDYYRCNCFEGCGFLWKAEFIAARVDLITLIDLNTEY